MMKNMSKWNKMGSQSHKRRFNSDAWERELDRIQKMHEAGYKEGMLRKELNLKAGRKTVK